MKRLIAQFLRLAKTLPQSPQSCHKARFMEIAQAATKLCHTRGETPFRGSPALWQGAATFCLWQIGQKRTGVNR